MPIAFAKLEFVQRSCGQNACAKAAYNSKSCIRFNGTDWQEACVYDWSKQKSPIYHEILLPKGVDPKFRSPEVLWNAAEQKEGRKNSQIALEMVLALPDDRCISIEDRVHLARTFIEELYVKQGLAAQIDIHPPESKRTISSESQEDDKIDHNWHAHVLITTRKFKENGMEFADHKARDLMPVIRFMPAIGIGKVVSAQDNGKLWAQHQNAFFEQKGLSLRVDPEGIVPQRHLGPVRMRARAFSLMYANDLRISLNALESEDPKNILEKTTQTKNIFTQQDIAHFIHKHVAPDKAFQVKEAFWEQANIVQLYDPNTQKPLGKFTTPQIILEEKQIIRIADKLFANEAQALDIKKKEVFAAHLTDEQKTAFHQLISGRRLSCIEGFAGTGKSYLLAALKNAYESEGYLVRGLGPDNATAGVLKEKGFSNVGNIYQFLFDVQRKKQSVSKHKEIWILDEAGKLGSRPLLELLKFANRYDAQVILSGDPAQLPSIERGIGFKAFVERYGASRLEDIQRQHEVNQRNIAKKLAKGEMGQALDAIANLGAIKWSQSKEEAVSNLMTSWASNKAKNPHESTIIIANSNQEIRVLNECVRNYRKEAGELPGNEFQCETAYGKIYVSCGDRIEFRKNDKELKVTNGMEGVLIKASEKSFTVQVEENKLQRSITFDPRTYHSFQLGYATTTFYRSQGRTADRAFVLHSPVMNKEMFYVGLTRHAKKVEFFVSNQDVKNLSDLKRQAFSQATRASTNSYLTHEDLENQRTQILQQQKIADLKGSDSTLSKLKGTAISTWEGIRTQTSKLIEKHKDRQPDKAFFNPKIKKENKPGQVREITFEEEQKIDPKHLHHQNQHDFKASQPINEPTSSRSVTWEKLSADRRSLFREYFKGVDRASSLHTIVKIEEESGKKSPHFQEWQQACGERNSLAYELVRCLKTRELRSILDAKGLEILQERASKHEELAQRKGNGQLDLDTQLKEKLESLLCTLFPEGPTRRDSKGLRFGTKGSLAVSCSGSKLGTFFDFEKQEGGGPLQLIQMKLGHSSSEAFKWAKDFLGQAPIPIPSHFTFKKPEKDQEWISLKPETSAPSLKDLSKGLAAHYQETARHTYKDAEGRTLFYTLRLEDENGKKIVLPLSYGYYRGNNAEPSWSLKGYPTKPLYNLHLLKEYPKAKVLIVEGEKTADAASQMFPKEKMICLSWIGGAGAVNKSDWSPLFMREVIIWPDNDQAGFEASDAICSILRRTGIKSLHEVDRGVLKGELPPKWDLADPIPTEKGHSFIKDCILRAREKGIGLNHLQAYLKTHDIDIDQRIAQRILTSIEERLRPSLEAQHGHKPSEIRSALLEATGQILKDPSGLKQVISSFSDDESRSLQSTKFFQENEQILAVTKAKDKSLER